jgi:hypothetical protein
MWVANVVVNLDRNIRFLCNGSCNMATTRTVRFIFFKETNGIRTRPSD